MNWSHIESGWNDYKADAQRHWSKLPGAQVASTLGRREDLATKVQQAYGISKEESETQISDWQSRQLERRPLPVVK